MINDKKQTPTWVAKHYEDKGRAGVSDDKEKKIEMYMFPRKSDEAMRLLKHMRSGVIRTENKSGLLVAVITKKASEGTSKSSKLKPRRRGKEAKMNSWKTNAQRR